MGELLVKMLVTVLIVGMTEYVLAGDGGSSGLVVSDKFSSRSKPISPSISDVTAAVLYARQLVNQSSWGVVCNIDYQTNMPFGNVVSYADGGSGTPYFYLTFLDQATANFSRVDSRASLSIGHIFASGDCGKSPDGKRVDPQEPICGKITLSGSLKLVTARKEKKFARTALFYNHPRFSELGSIAKTFTIFKLDISNIYVVNSYKNPIKRPPVKAYYKVLA